MLTGRTRGEVQDRALRMLYEAGPRRAFEAVRDRLTGDVLEVGCGTGLLFEAYRADARVTAIEPDADFLPLARQRAAEAPAEIRIVRNDVQRTGFADGCFDAAVVQLVLCSVADARRGLGEILRVLRPGGLLYVYEHVVSDHALYRAIQNLSDPIVSRLAEGCHWNRDTGALVRSMAIRIEHETRTTLRKGLMPPLPIVSLIARNHQHS